MDQNKYEIIFINDYATALLSAAFDSVSPYENLCAKRMDAAEVIKSFPEKPSKRTCFVLCRFEGDCFEHLKSIGAAVYGPQVILHYIRENKPLPKVPYPLYSTALMDAVATVTSVTGADREYLLSSIQMLHGQASRDLFDGVNVVITPKVGSKKYLVGASRGLHILLPTWITEAWKLSAIQDPINMMRPEYTERFKVPVFSQLVICVSGLSTEERKEVCDLVTNNGGSYSGMMKVGETTHLIVKQASGVKYSHAKKWKIQIVNVRWLVDSVSKGYALDEEDYRVAEVGGSSSTPTGDATKRSISFDNLSVISHANTTSTRIDETRTESNSAEGFVRPKSTPKSGILSGCSLALRDCTQDEVKSYSEIIKQLGGRLYTELQDQVSEPLTHVIVGTLKNQKLSKNTEPGLLLVNGSWLVACSDSAKRVPEANYLISQATEAEDDTLRDIDPGENIQPNVDTEDLNLINQYFANGGLAEVDDFTHASANPAHFDHTSGTIRNAGTVDNHPEESSEPTRSQGIFSKSSFFLHEELSDKERDDIMVVIREAGGSILSSCTNANFVVAPFFVRTLPDVSEMCRFVTPFWVDHCATKSSVCIEDLSKEKAFCPLARSGPPPLKGCVISLSGFEGRDRSLLTSYSQALGCIVQEYFLRKAIPGRKLVASTHLVAAKPDGRKWPAARQWGLPAVSRQWLYACAEEWSLVNELEYPVEGSLGLENTRSTALKAEGEPRKSVLPNQHVKDRRLTEMCLNEKVLQPIQTPEKGDPIQGPIYPPGSTPKSTLDTMRTPDWVNNTVKSDHTSMNSSSRDSLGRIFKPSPPVSEQVARCLKRAINTTAALPKRKLDFSDDGPVELPLKEVVICVAKHLSSRQVELNNVAKQLGGDFKWTYDGQVCTHIIAEHQPLPEIVHSRGEKEHASSPHQTPETPSGYSSTQAALDSDVIAAKRDGKFIVHPKWLTTCLASSSRLPEADFPPSSLSVVDTPRLRLESPTELAKPAAKIARTASSSLLGDVSRRLELMLGVPAKCGSESRAKLPAETKDIHTLDIPKGKRCALEDDACSDVVDPTGVSFLTGNTGSTSRRLRRNPRRGNYNTSFNNSPHLHPEGIGGLKTGEEGKSELRTAVEGSVDRAQPSQSLMVRWQYEDALPCSPNESLPVSGTAPDHRNIHSPLCSNPGQGMVGIEAVTTRDRLSRRGTSGLATSSIDQDSGKFKEPSAKPQANGEVCPAKQQPERHVIAISGLPSDERDHYAAIVAQLGGEVDSQLSMSERTTHLIVHTPGRSEKCLICLATGKWMLHKSYLDACSRESRWVDESPYEWGGPGTEPLLMQLSPAQPRSGGSGSSTLSHQRQQAQQTRDLARAARRWRLAGGKAFENWRVIFGSGCDKETSFRRVIEAGGGQVLASGPPYPPASVVTHAFFKRRPTGSNLSSQLPPEYRWLRIDYLCAYLTAGQDAPQEEFALGNSC
ncbi:unnamed protein product [Calicophoron daubneyi]|uniref:BRCT domain-containing protein n=1 Tax=Calicophoron daubneyi TaxID=300641 RepID=A0AAV2TVW6_CALDB